MNFDNKRWLALDPQISVTVLPAVKNAPRDDEAAQFWIDNGYR